MAQFPALPLWTDAYLADTTHLTTLEHGAYLLLLMALWRTPQQKLPNDRQLLARITKLSMAQFMRIEGTLKAFCQIEGDWITQGRLTDEGAVVRQKSRKASDSAKARWLKYKGSQYANASPKNANAMRNACELDAPLTLNPYPQKKEREKERKAPARMSRLLETWQLSSEDIAYARKREFEEEKIKLMEENFKNHFLANGKTMANWHRAWCKWVTNEANWNGARGNGSRGSRSLQDDSKSCSKAADRLIEATKRGEFVIAPRPSLVSPSSESNIRLLPKGRGT